MNEAVRQLEPKEVWNHFADLNAIPRASKKEEQVIAFAKDFGERLGLETKVDGVGNVIIRKPASVGMADRTPIVLQSHLDMVHQKNSDSNFDFATQGIEMFVDGDWVKAKGTTLGADNGMGVASIMTILSSQDIPHPPLEALLTIDEETGMTGAQGLEPGWLSGKILLNLDTEEDDELTIGCAGGCDVTATGTYQPETLSDSAAMQAYRVTVRGLTGGHSGVDIHLGRANSNKLMTRVLWAAEQECCARVAAMDGGGLRNAIPRESVSTLVVPIASVDKLESVLADLRTDIEAEYATTDPGLELVLEKTDPPTQVLPVELQRNLLAALYACPSGIHRMCPDIEGLVQTSNNLARVHAEDGKLSVMCLTRSSVNSERDDLANAIQAVLGITGASVQTTGAYPGWQPAPSSAVVKLMSDLYTELFGERPRVAACHAGLECGIIGRNYPDMDMISFGPTIRGAHSPDERVQISSVQKYWKFLLATLAQIPMQS